jgi:hypothetical protein
MVEQSSTMVFNNRLSMVKNLLSWLIFHYGNKGKVEMGERESDKEDKPKNYTVKVAEGMTLTGAASASSISTISGSIRQSFDTLRGTFNVSQNSMANSLHLDQNLEYLKKIAESMEKAVKLAEEQRDEAVKDAKKDRNHFYVGVVIGAVGIVVGAIIGIMALL